jgi:hypothetical protein
MPAKDILKAALAAVGEKIRKLLDKAENTNHQCEMHQETYKSASISFFMERKTERTPWSKALVK